MTSPRVVFRVVVLALIGALSACGTPGPAAPEPSTSIPPLTAPRTTLAGEKVRLSELFLGTPVTFAMRQDGSLRTTVPRRFSFDPAAIAVKPPLAAVLDRLAKSQLQSTSWMRVSAPSDPGTRGGNLARDRAFSVRDYLMAQGIASTRLKATGLAQTEHVEIVVGEGR